ncbi:hypothetical protein GC207_07320 [bacterium]|nr:hypothetical protein [bacterium]
MRLAFFSIVLHLMGGHVLGQGSVMQLATDETVLIGRFAKGPENWPASVNAAQFATQFGSANSAAYPAEVQARQFFANGGTSLHVIRVSDSGSLTQALVGDSIAATGIYAAQSLSNARLLVAPELSFLGGSEFTNALAAYRQFVANHDIILILDPPPGLASSTAMIDWANNSLPADDPHLVVYFPYLQVMLDGNLATVPPSGAMAGIYARNDSTSGIWTAPAGTSLILNAGDITPALTSTDSDNLNAQNINAIRSFPGTGVVPWGARTRDLQDAENRYVPVARTGMWMAASISRALAFAAINDNDATLWSQVRAMVESFLNTLWRDGAFQGIKASDAYFVRCDSSTTTAADILNHRANLIYGVALLRPAEFSITSLTFPTFDPDRAPPEPVLESATVDGELQFAVPTAAGFNYVWESTTDPAIGPWKEISALTLGDGSWLRAAYPTKAARSFFRLRVAPAR